MKNFVVLLLICLITIYKQSYGAELIPGCPDGWVPYKDEKCYKLVNEFLSYENAELTCSKQVEEELVIPLLLTIKTAQEQQFLTNFLFNESQIVDSVWLAAKRVDANGLDFQWPDGPMEFSNWHEGNPTEIPGNDCTQIIPKGLKGNQLHSHSTERAEVDGLWSDVACSKHNLVLCQKLQSWTPLKIQQAVLELRRNLVPIGFIYTQLPSQPEATAVWPSFSWEEVTEKYAGLFFRVEGGQSAEFGSIQEQQVPRFSRATTIGTSIGNYAHDVSLPEVEGATTIPLYTGGETGQYYAMNFYVSGTEVRPRNQAVRIWRRIA